MDSTSNKTPQWLPRSYKELPKGKNQTRRSPRPALTAVPLIRAVLAVLQAVAPLPVGDALVQLLALELEPAAASQERWGGGRHVGSCTQQQVRKPPKALPGCRCHQEGPKPVPRSQLH